MMKRNLMLMLLAMSMSVNGIYARSIQDLKAMEDLPRMTFPLKRLNFSGKSLNDLSGLGEILKNVKNIKKVRIITFEDNSISRIPEGAFAVAENMWVLNLAGNELSGEGLKGIAGSKSLRALILNSNNVEDIPSEVLDSLPKLTFIFLHNNPISAEKIAALKKRGFRVSTLPITRANVRKAGVVTGALLTAIVGAAATYHYYPRDLKIAGKSLSEQLAIADNRIVYGGYSFKLLIKECYELAKNLELNKITEEQRDEGLMLLSQLDSWKWSWEKYGEQNEASKNMNEVVQAYINIFEPLRLGTAAQKEVE